MSHTGSGAALPCSFGCHRLRAIEAVAIPDQVVQDSLVDVVVITVLATHLPHTRTLVHARLSVLCSTASPARHHLPAVCQCRQCSRLCFWLWGSSVAQSQSTAPPRAHYGTCCRRESTEPRPRCVESPVAQASTSTHTSCGVKHFGSASTPTITPATYFIPGLHGANITVFGLC